jgi:Homeodomain-like domain
MTRPARERRVALELARQGLNSCEIARRTGIPRSTIAGWRRGRAPRAPSSEIACLRCTGYQAHPFPELTDHCYSYLLGIYLGDGCLLRGCRGVYRLHICLDAQYPVIVCEAVAAAAVVMPASRASSRPHLHERSVEVTSHSQHWPCLFPQHGPGPKHKRSIKLQAWQRDITDRHPWQLLRGLVHSDGSRFLNRIRHPRKIYVYPRYTFTNYSAEIRGLFCEYCDKVGVEWRQMNHWNISVARRDAVALMDRFIGPKR